MFEPRYLLLVLSVIVIALGQLAFKFAALQFDVHKGIGLIGILSYNVVPLLLVAGALLLYIISTVGWIYALRTVPLSIAYMFNAIAFLLVPATAFIAFGEEMPRFFFLGVIAIIFGIVVIGL